VNCHRVTKRNEAMRIIAISAPFAVAIALVCGSAFGGAVPQESLADAAKRVRAEKEQKARHSARGSVEMT
jgi:hypothetical protein